TAASPRRAATRARSWSGMWMGEKTCLLRQPGASLNSVPASEKMGGVVDTLSRQGWREVRVARKSDDRKRRTRAHVIADLAVNHLERQVLLAGCTVERIIHDYGIDLILFSYDEHGWIEPGQTLIQVKATEKAQWLKDGQTISV